jgi:hypothetical protein
MTVPRPPRRPADALSRTAGLTALADPTTMLTALDLRDGAVLAGTAGLLSRLVALSSPWAQLLPFRVWVGAYGLLWCLESARLTPEDAQAIRELPPVALCHLVADIAAACPRPSDAEAYLCARALGRCA